MFGNAHTDNNTSLTYVAPKQPKSVSNLDQTNEPSGKRQAAVVCAKPVDLYKMYETSFKLAMYKLDFTHVVVLKVPTI